MCSGSFNVVSGAFRNQAALKVGDGSKDVKNEFTSLGSGINLLLKAGQPDILLFQVFASFKEFFEGTPKRSRRVMTKLSPGRT